MKLHEVDNLKPLYTSKPKERAKVQMHTRAPKIEAFSIRITAHLSAPAAEVWQQYNLVYGNSWARVSQCCYKAGNFILNSSAPDVAIDKAPIIT